MAELPPPEIEHTYHPKSSLSNAAFIGLQAGGMGVFVSAVQNALGQHNKGALGIFTRTGGTIGFFAAMGFTFAFTESVASNIRQKDDSYNGFVGGCSAGLLAGLRARSIPMAVASCGVMGGLVATFDAAGSTLASSDHREMDSLEKREERRRRFFKKKPSLETGEVLASESA